MWPAWTYFFSPMLIAIRDTWLTGASFAAQMGFCRVDRVSTNGRVEWKTFRHSDSNVIFLIRVGGLPLPVTGRSGNRSRKAQVITFRHPGRDRRSACL